MKNHLKILFLVSFILLVSLSCGKVTQQVSDEDDVKIAHLSYSVQTHPTEDIKVLSASLKPLSTEDMFTFDDLELYAQVFGVHESGKLTHLSWGHGKFLLESKTLVSEQKLATSQVTPNVQSMGVVVDEQVSSPTYKYSFKSQSFQKNGVKISQSNYQWTSFKFKKKSKEYFYEMSSKKLKLEYPYYLVSVFNEDASQYHLKVIDSNLVSPNKTLDVGPITLYDTFLASLFLLDLGSENPFITEENSWSSLEALFPYSFLETVAYRLPKNNVKEFRVQKPVFQLESEHEEFYLKMLKLLLVDDKKKTETKRFIKSFKEPWLTEAIRDFFLDNLKNLDE